MKNWFNRLFWKIFLAFWLGSVSVVFITAYVVGEIAERSSVREAMEYKALAQAERLINRYESGRKPEVLPPSVHRGKHPRFINPHRKPLPLSIKDDQNRWIFGSPLHKGERALLNFEVKGASGKLYQVMLPAGPVSSFITRMQTYLFSVQALLLLVASTLVSALLSLIVVRPVNRLRLQVEAFHRSDMAIELDQGLLRRGDEIGELAREFDRMASYVESTLQGRQRLLQDVSHELRAPLARLQAAVGLTEQKLGQDDKLVVRMNRECERLSRLIEEMLSLARLDSMEAGEGAFDLLVLVNQEIENTAFVQPQRVVRLDNQSAGQTQVQGNEELMRRALSNVFSNLLQHTEPDAAVDIALTASTQKARLVVRDHGPGVSDAALTALFDPFYRKSHKDNGYGLGLSIAKRAIERLGGKISASNAPAGGLVVVIELPACKSG